jgi:hypothetical protein
MLDLPLRRLTWLAQALQLAGDDRVPVAPVRHDVIHDVRRRHDSALQAELAQRMLCQLMVAQPLPARGLVEPVPRGGLSRVAMPESRWLKICGKP